MNTVTTLVEQHDHFRDSRIESLQRIDDTTLKLRIIVEDDDAEPTHAITCTFKGVIDARLLDNSVLPFVDMMGGITVLEENGRTAFAIGAHNAMLHIQNAPFFIICDAIEMHEEQL